MEIVVENLTKLIKGTTVLEDINLSLHSGKVYGLRGKNGSGKTMLMRAISGLIHPTKGSVQINGKVLAAGEFPPSIGIMIENPAFVNKYTGFKNLSYLASIQNKIESSAIEEALRKVGLDPHDKRPFRKYSLGMKQRLGIACAVMEEPDLLLLDEPMNALDPSGVLMVQKLVHEQKNRGALTIVACHDAEELDNLADEILIMAEGKIVNQEIKDGVS